MSLAVVTCQCGSVENLVRSFLQQSGYPDWLTIPISKGKEKSRATLNSIPRYPEVEMLDHLLAGASKWAVIIGWNENGCRWSDISQNAAKSRIDAELIVKTFA